ncbi:MAG TPA: hypothetical protein VK886_23130 [Vicinamibacterales bacterium]|nr:hypothetical protein [Vicinamibacterales bacterium]
MAELNAMEPLRTRIESTRLAFWPPPTIAILLSVLLAVTVAGEPGAPARHRTGLPGTGAIEGEIALPAHAAARTGEMYVSATGEAREIQPIPVVVSVQGVMPAAPGRPSGRLELTQRGEAFDPSILVVPVGAEVKFPNADPVFHNVFSYSRPRRFDLGRYRRGEFKTVAFDRPGYVKVLCEVHKWMRAAVVVVENPYYAIVPETGRFRIEGIPAGRHSVAIEHFDRRARVVEVDVPEGGVARVTPKT